MAAALAAGNGPVAVDAERASGYRYTQRAYLVQLRREPAGTVLIDPIGFDGGDWSGGSDVPAVPPVPALAPEAAVPAGPAVPVMAELGAALAGVEWVLHAASQDLPCLAELGLVPDKLFDTELAGRLAGFERVGLAAMVERVLGYRLRKVHGAADWSRRPLPRDWLSYAALDVELLIPLRDALHAELSEQGKLEWAEQEFEAVRLAPPPGPRAEPWRRTSGVHRVRKARQLAAVRELWTVRDRLAQQRDISPGRVLPDSAIVEAALADPTTVEELIALPIFSGRAQRRQASMWLEALRHARELPRCELPDPNPPSNGPPPVNRWADRDPEAAARLAAARSATAAIAGQHRLPVENLLQPELVRRLCWEPPPAPSVDVVAETLRAGGARPWQIELTAGPLTAALQP